ncbi:transmembrane protein, putative [Medicago truncatula]|uniref:Transmembrane protein, putative n=1 Tax=Medicago truncatula TaxID=3880 RepID=G7IAF2_MEDTR|nr:transmembrane protein, putative [Medicago truncatula]
MCITFQILNVYYISNIKNDILSLGQLLLIGYDIHMEGLSFFIKYGRNYLIIKAPM